MNITDELTKIKDNLRKGERKMIGTITNCATILTGSFIGSRLKNGMKEDSQAAVMQALGLATVALGVANIAQNMPKSHIPVLFIISLALGGFLGHKFDFDGRFQRVVDKFSQGSNLAQGLGTAVLLFCIGTLSIVGPIESALNGNHTYLLSNAVLDGMASIVLSSTYGFGIAFAAVILFCWQGSIYALASIIAPLITEGLLAEISIIGSILIMGTGLSILKIVDIKTMNILPALLVPVVFYSVLGLLGISV